MDAKIRYVYQFKEAVCFSSDVLGSKGYGLAQMVKAGYPVPPGGVITVAAVRSIAKNKKVSENIRRQLRRLIALLEIQTQKRFGGIYQPLLLSVRSGAKFSMPGMMNSVLNIGLTKENLPGLIQCYGEKCALDTKKRFENGYKKTVLNGSGKIPSDPWQQLEQAIVAVAKSWNGKRAVLYRRANNIPDKCGTAINIQVMVLGNSDGFSGTGVVFSRNVKNGDKSLYGEFLPNAQGEDIVSGKVTPESISYLEKESPKLYKELGGYVKKLEILFGDVVEVEYTVEQGKLYLLQVRVAKRSPEAAVRIAVDMVESKRWTKERAIQKVGNNYPDESKGLQFDEEALSCAELLACGLPASDGAAVGQAVFSSERAKKLSKKKSEVILVRKDTCPDDLPGMLVAKAIVTGNGGETCHAAVVARDLNKPAVVGVSKLFQANGTIPIVSEGEILSVDGNKGKIYRGTIPVIEVALDPKVQKFLSWKGRKVKIVIDFSVVSKHWSVNRMLNDFYVTGALQKLLADTPLAGEAKDLHDRIRKQVANVFVVYLLIACAGELRHTSEENRLLKSKVEVSRLVKEYKITQSDEGGPIIRARFLEEIRQVSTSKVIDFIQLGIKVFRMKGWSRSYGGQRWARILETVLMYLQAKISAEVFVDRVFDLRHNGGALFDKHAMVEDKTDEDELWQQLNIKKRKKTPSRLIFALEDVSFGRVSSVAPEILDLQEKWQGRRTGG